MSLIQQGKLYYSDLSTSERNVANALADWADDEGGNVYPSLERIGLKAGVSRRQAQRVVQQLRDLGYVEVIREATPNRPPLYQLHPEVLTYHRYQKWLADQRGDNMSPRNDTPGEVTGAESEVTRVSPRNEVRDDTDDTPRGDTDDTPEVTIPAGRDDTRVTLSVRDPSDIRQGDPSDVDVSRETSLERFVDEHDVEILEPVDEKPLRLRLWDAYEALFGYRPVGAEATLWGKLMNELVEMEADPDEVPVRAERFVRQWGPDKLTPASLVKWWNRFGSRLGAVNVSSKQLEEWNERERLERELDEIPDAVGQLERGERR